MNEPRQPVNVYQASDKAFFVNLLEHGEFLESYEHFLRGEVLITKPTKDGKGLTEEWVQRYPAKVNNYGVNEIISFLRPICESKIMAITEFDEEFIDKLGYDDIRAFTKLLTENYDNFEFKNIAALESVIVSGVNIISAQLRRSFKGSTLDAFTTQTQITEQRQITQPEQRQGILSRLPFFGARKESMLKV